MWFSPTKPNNVYADDDERFIFCIRNLSFIYTHIRTESVSHMRRMHITQETHTWNARNNIDSKYVNHLTQHLALLGLHIQDSKLMLWVKKQKGKGMWLHFLEL